MISTLKAIMEIRGMSGANRLIFYFRKIPVIGKLLPASAYAETALKRTLSVIVYILKAIWAFLSKFAYLGLMVYMPVKLAGSELTLTLSAQYQLYLQVLLCLSFLVAAVSSAVILEPKRDKYIFVKLMRLPAERYMRVTLTLRGISFAVTFIPALMVFGNLLGAPLWQGGVLALLLTFWRIACEALHLWIFDKYGIVVVKKTSWVWTAIGAGYLLAYVPLLPGFALVDSHMLFSLPLVLGVTVLGALCAVYIARYPDYRNAVDAVTKIDDPLLDMGRMMKEARVKDVATREQQYTAEQLNPGQFAGKSGYAYLNAIFFSRHRRLLIHPVQRRLVIIGALFAAALLTLLFSQAAFNRMAHYLISALPTFLILMNYTSIGERVCKAMFYNCDLSLLRYGFYREQSAILSNFRIRLLRISLLNLIPAAAICLAVNLLILLSGENWGAADAVIFCVTIVALSLFFSVHHLFMYYIFQPYSTELNVKNPFFTIVNSIVLAAGFIAIQFKSEPGIFAFIVVLSAVVYMLAALILVYKFSGRTFRVK
ncbi:hypothetical protein P40081_09875 [Paenibacillus sp. FSL P4-0081]|uniref:hypothetical protein n=1 Tax=Paenibacillus sp. FSL P4-0081 TaxID=1536769 RepID=UPI0004F79E56|nr:hypothetical protein [Paenibacillus sp. FSL P4-0081]AIQ28452.1 hypothetical protein P40081_09875 [Paenibacillus sp. FSL P4-0081]